MTLSSQIRALADRMKAHDAVKWGYKATPDEVATILAALGLAERVEAPETVEVVAQAIDGVEYAGANVRLDAQLADGEIRAMAQAALQALKGPTNAG